MGLEEKWARVLMRGNTLQKSQYVARLIGCFAVKERW